MSADAVFYICSHKFVYYMRLHKCLCGRFCNKDMIQSEEKTQICMRRFMREQLLLLIRISKPDYNKTLYEDYKLYMNPQMAFKKDNMTAGQKDIMEGAITNIPSKLLYSTDEKKTWKLLGDITLMHKNNNAYIYCMYGLKYDVKYYNAKSNKYFYPIPWSYIEPLWQGNGTEMIVIINTSEFINKFLKAAKQKGLAHSYGKVHYDLEEKLQDKEYLHLAMNDSFESVYHKMADGYELQKEVRFTIICPDKPDHYELQLDNDQKLKFTTIPLSYGKNIGVELSNLEFDDTLGLPVRFSSDIKYYESE